MNRDCEQHLVVVNGRAEREVQPDRTSWTIGVEAHAEGYGAAFDECARRAGEMIDQLRSVVGDDGEVATPWVRASPHWDGERRRYVGYVASTTISVRSALELAGRVAQAAMSGGAGRIDGPGFEVSRDEELGEELLAGALEAARRKAERLAEAADRRLGRAVSIRERALEREHGEPLVTSMTFADAERAMPEIVAADRTIAADVIVAFEFAD